ncbi:hypothetical protein C8Q74DRAFT_1211933 [Fomes fomentarius]|nr:hypothetical protein C8Q74DRAFT_1211933 [Fomes fomentarius]
MSDDQTKRLVVSQYQAAWNDYYAWEPDYSAKKLASLRATDRNLAASSSRITQLDPLLDALEHSEPRPTASKDVSSQSMCFVDTMGRIHPKYLHVEEIRIPDCDVPRPYPPYESCTPISRNLLHGDDPIYMAFLPLADDSKFDSTNYADLHTGFAWQEEYEYRDSDALEVILEASRRLHFEHGVSLQQIDQTSVLPLLYKLYRARAAFDTVPWPGSSRTTHPPLPDLSPPAADNLKVRVANYRMLWCRDSGCLQAHCMTHDFDDANPDFDSPDGASVGSFRPLPVAEPCGAECCLNHSDTSEDDVIWTEADIDDLQLICRIAPPTRPCDLAKLCVKPCYEVNHGATLIQHDSYRPPCDHSGPCSVAMHCPCARSQVECSKLCACPKTCTRKWQGCQCTSHQIKSHKKSAKETTVPPCAEDWLCPCRKAKRECDPEVCWPCGKDCMNMQLQKGLSKRVQVKQSKHGMGLYLCEDVKSGDFMMEYVGELIYDPTFDSRGLISEHLQRNYVFGLSQGSETSVDSMFAGNPARFINHAPHKKANVTVSIPLVNGEQRIGIYAKKNIARGKELLMNYGPEFGLESKG